MLKNTTQCPQSVLKLGPLTSKSSRLIMRPRCFPQTCCLTSTHLILVVCYYLCILDSRNWRSTTDLFSGKRYHFDFDSVFHQLHLFLSSFDLFTELSSGFKTSRRPPEFRRLLDCMSPATLIITVCL